MQFIILNDCDAVVKETRGVYPESSVLAGQPRICWVATFETLEEAQIAYPDAVLRCNWTAPRNFFNHLPEGYDYA